MRGKGRKKAEPCRRGAASAPGPAAGATLEVAIALRDGGADPDAAVAALREVAASAGCGDDRAAAAYELALLLHGLGRHREGDAWLRRLGFRHRLADAAFRLPAAGSQASAEAIGVAASGALPLRVVDGLLAPPLLAALQAAMGPGSPFWPAHGYPTPAFFSYNAPLAGAAAGPRSGGAQQPPGGELIAAAAEALLPLAMDLLDAPPPDPAPGPFAGRSRWAGPKRDKRKARAGGKVALGSVEWWAHSRRGEGAGHQLHFDLDEAALPAWRAAAEAAEAAEGAGGAPPPAPHPEVSCVVYLDAPAEGGRGPGAPTLVLDQDVNGCPGSGSGRGWLCFPQTNRALLFRGGLLHGVVPAGSGPAAGSQMAPTGRARVGDGGGAERGKAGGRRAWRRWKACLTAHPLACRLVSAP